MKQSSCIHKYNCKNIGRHSVQKIWTPNIYKVEYIHYIKLWIFSLLKMKYQTRNVSETYMPPCEAISKKINFTLVTVKTMGYLLVRENHKFDLSVYWADVSKKSVIWPDITFNLVTWKTNGGHLFSKGHQNTKFDVCSQDME